MKTNSEIKRYPLKPRDPLQAWDAADELIQAHLASIPLKGQRILIINDAFGALSCSLVACEITSYSDSYVSKKGIELNSGGKITTLNELEALSGIYDLVLIKIPKNMSFLEDILCNLTHHLDSTSKVICGSMVKHLPKTSFDLLEKYIGSTTTSLAQKKARLIFAEFQKNKVASPYPLLVSIPTFAKKIVNHSNVFSREKLDIGTRFLLDHLPQGGFKTILDLGCGNGVVGIAAKRLNPQAKMIFSDESAMALQSARANYQNHFDDEAVFLWTNCYEDQTPESLDLVLCNPPFHQQTTVGDFIALQMFRDAHRAMKKGARIRVIGNSHLAYQRELMRIFGNSEIIATNQKFMIVDAVKMG